jgi:glycerol-3-phosphate dehydrogenase
MADHGCDPIEAGRQAMAKISILGAGGWGTALAILTANQGHKVSLWARSEASADELALPALIATSPEL